MDTTKPQSELVADQHGSRNQRIGAGNDVNVKSPPIAAAEIEFTATEEIRSEIWREVFAIAEQDNDENFDQQQVQDRLEDEENGCSTTAVPTVGL